MGEPPAEKMKPSPVPEPAQSKDCEGIGRRAEPAFAVPAERNVDVLAEPAGERDVPPPPEIPDPVREVWIFEVFGQADPEQAGGSQGDVGVAGEVRVDLEAEEDRCGQHLRSGQGAVGKERVGDRCNRVGNHDLLCVAPQHEEAADPEIADRDLRFAGELPHEILRALDRAGHDLREEGEVERVAVKTPLRGEIATIDVDHVGERLEGVK